ncbi:MAG: OmcA/MtrC family decaheme c-type cytochrome [Trichlorobacter sp.]|nr:OmcA/MtrC family decaheme c-type cytochrome [Trichlorobacter sp.]
MSGRKLWYFISLCMIAMLPLIGCSGSSSKKSDAGGVKATITGTVDGYSAGASKAAASDKLFAYDAEDGKQLGDTDINADGSFSIDVTLPKAQTVVLLKADSATPYSYLLPIDFTGKNTDQAITLTGKIDAASTAIASSLLDGDSNTLKEGVEYEDVKEVTGEEATGEEGEEDEDIVKPSSVVTYNKDQHANIKFDGQITRVSIPADKKPVVSFMVTDKDNVGYKGIPAASFAFYFTQLKADKSSWVNYRLITKAEGAANARNAGRIGLPTNFGAGDVNFVDNGNGTYSFTIKEDIESYSKIEEGKFAGNTQGTVDVKEVKYDANLIHRAAVVFNPGNPENVAMLTYDFTPSSNSKYVNPNDPAGKSNLARDITNMKSCDACHGENGGIGYNQVGGRAGHFAGRPDVKICVLCHTEQNVIEGRISAEFTNLIHTIHANKQMVKAGKATAVDDIAGIDASHVGYPQDIRTCQACHSGFDSIGQKGLTPSPNSCNSCHNDGSMKHHIVKNAACIECHAPGFHKVHYATGTVDSWYNGNLPDGAAKIEYEIKNVTVNTDNRPEVTFVVKKDGKVVDLKTLYNDVDKYVYVNPNNGNTYSSSILIQIQKNVQDDNNNAVQYLEYNKHDDINVTDALEKENTDILKKNSDNSYTATGDAIDTAQTNVLTAILRGTFKQTVAGADHVIVPAPAIFKFSGKVGDVQFEERRTSVTDAKCNSCHGMLVVKTSHVYGKSMGTFETCISCHKGRSGGGQSASASALGHIIHGGSMRATPRTNWNATYPGTLNNCTHCHTDDGYDYSSAEAQKAKGKMLPITYGGTSTTAITHACAGCHDNGPAIAHMVQNGGVFKGAAADAYASYESCMLCHGPGKTAAIKAVHSK